MEVDARGSARRTGLLSTGADLAKAVLDAGPLIALLHGVDPDHASALRGFEELTRARVRLITPLADAHEVTGAEPSLLSLPSSRSVSEVATP